MSREKKKGTSGNAKAFITRAKALKKLQVSLQEFRRLCILKGIYPRDPRKKLEGSDKTYYLRKDIDFLAHERLISTLRQQNSHKKKVVKARSKRRIDILKRLALSKPKARLDHLVVERYPNFTDAIRELSDPLCVVSLFANLPADHKVGIAPHRVINCQRLLKEFHHFVAESNSLKRVFVSIKGYYFQARVCGEVVTWVTPHRFSQILPADVDYSVMLTFLELYECILSFVNFRLYTGQNLAYPPKISRVADANALELASVKLEKLPNSGEAKEKLSAIIESNEKVESVPRVSEAAVKEAQQMLFDSENQEEEEESDQEGAENAQDGEVGEEDGDEKDGMEDRKGVFASKSFVLGREVPYVELEFVLKASGAVRVVREDDLQDDSDQLAAFSHWIIDRPAIVGERNMSLEYVQPQYVFDSINALVQLPTSLYAPGCNLPPHLSPFVSDEDDGGYRPWFKEILERIKAGDASVVAEAAAVVYAEGEANARKQQNKQVDSKKNNVEEVNENASQDEKEPDTGATERDDMDVLRSEETGNTKAPAGDVVVGGELEESEDDSEDDEEGEEEKVLEGKEMKLEKEGKEMATLMLSRKKMKLYARHKKDEQAKKDVKDKLVAKRKKLETERAKVTEKPAKRKRRK